MSQGTIDGIVERIPAAARVPHGVIPLGFEPDDFDVAARRRHRPRRGSIAADGLVHLCYVGTLLPTGVEHAAPAASRPRARPRATIAAAGAAAAAFFRHQQSVGFDRVPRAADRARAAASPTRSPKRPGGSTISTRCRVLTQASAILLLGSSERHYTASKLYPALLAKRPILALFHEASSVVSILRAAGV